MTDLIRRADAMREMWKHANGKTVLGGQTYQSLTLEVALDAIAALPAVTMGVRKLVWRDDGTNGHETDHAFGFYEVYPSPKGDMLSRDGVDSGVFPTLDAAKAAAQADYAARIIAALEPAAPDPAAIREAALREAEKALRDWQDSLNANRFPETAITVGVAADVIFALIPKGAAE